MLPISVKENVRIAPLDPLSSGAHGLHYYSVFAVARKYILRFKGWLNINFYFSEGADNYPEEPTSRFVSLKIKAWNIVSLIWKLPLLPNYLSACA